MINFCDEQTPYQLYKIGLNEYYDNNLESAVDILQKVNTNDDDLNYKIKSLLYTLADEILNNFIMIENNYSINYQIEYYKSIKKISNKIKDNVDKRLFSIYLKKGDVLLKNNNYEEAYEYYIFANSIDSQNSSRIEIKINNIIIAVLNDVYNLLQNKENILAYNIIEEKRKLVETDIKKEIYLGDTYNSIINVLGYPIDEIIREQFDNSYIMLTYSFNDNTYRLFLKDKILIDIERD